MTGPGGKATTTSAPSWWICERGRVVDVLPARTADSLARWLAARPAIKVISRDRHGPYADGVRRGAPQAKEVADRFHLMLNLRTAVEKELSGLRRFLAVPKGAGRRPGEVPASTRLGVHGRRRSSINSGTPRNGARDSASAYSSKNSSRRRAARVRRS
jgi:hypothetical protein